MILKSPGFVPFGANLTYFVPTVTSVSSQQGDLFMESNKLMLTDAI